MAPASGGTRRRAMKLSDLAERIGARLLGDADLEVGRVRVVDEAGAGDVGFAHSAPERKAAFSTQATALLVDEGFAAEHAHELPCAVLAAASAPRALALAIDALHPAGGAPRAAGVHPSAVVDPAAVLGGAAAVGALAVVGRCTLGAGTSIGPLAHVGDGAVVGRDCRVGAGAVVLGCARLGDRVVVGPGCVVGDEGFVYAPDGDQNLPVRHVAGVVLEDDVELGANVCVDRGVLRDTRVGRGTKVDNLAQIGHDVVIAENVVVIAQVGIAGDARIGAGAVLAGQSGVKEHVSVGARARVGGQAGVTRSIDDGAVVSGTPAIPHMTWLRAMARMQHLESLERRVRALEAKPREPSDER